MQLRVKRNLEGFDRDEGGVDVEFLGLGIGPLALETDTEAGRGGPDTASPNGLVEAGVEDASLDTHGLHGEGVDGFDRPGSTLLE